MSPLGGKGKYTWTRPLAAGRRSASAQKNAVLRRNFLPQRPHPTKHNRGISRLELFVSGRSSGPVVSPKDCVLLSGGENPEHCVG